MNSEGPQRKKTFSGEYVHIEGTDKPMCPRSLSRTCATVYSLHYRKTTIRIVTYLKVTRSYGFSLLHYWAIFIQETYFVCETLSKFVQGKTLGFTGCKDSVLHPLQKSDLLYFILRFHSVCVSSYRALMALVIKTQCPRQRGCSYMYII